MSSKDGTAAQLRRVLMIKTNDSPREQGLENIAGRVGFPISTFPSIFRLLTQPELEHFHAVKSFYSVSRYGGLSFNAWLKRINRF